MTHPFVSVIVPVYNVENYLRGCLDSLLNQTLQNFEVILVDDGSTDSSGKIADEYAKKHKNFKVIHQENKGLSGARNTGLKKAKGTYVFFLDSDDYIHPDFINLMSQTAENEQADLIVAKLQHTQELYHKIPAGLKLKDIKIKRFYRPFEDYLKHKELVSNVCVKFHKREALGDLKFKEGIYFEDALFTTLFMGQAKSAVVLDAPLYYYYSNPNSIMRSEFNEKKVLSYVTVIQDIYTYTLIYQPSFLKKVRKDILNKRVKMTMNQAVRKQKEISECLHLFEVMALSFKDLYDKGIISYDGLKLKHRIALALLLKGNAVAAHKFMALFGS